MPDSLFPSVDQYLADLYLPPDPVLDACLDSITTANLPPIQVSAHFGNFLHLLARIHHARRILEIGTLAGYSTIWLARALPPDGHLTTLEFDPHHAQVATANIARAGLSHLVDIRVGAALDTLPQLAKEAALFDFIFIDADKPNYPAYFSWSLKLLTPGGLILIDNVIRRGGILDPHSPDPNIIATRHLHELIAKTPHIHTSTLQTVGQKGHDGFTLIQTQH